MRDPIRPATGLQGKRVVITRASHQQAELADLLRGRGAEPIPYPCIDIVPPSDLQELDAALEAAAAGFYDWLIVTSANAVPVLASRVAELGLSLSGLRVATVGPKTADIVQDALRIDASVVAEEHTAEGLLASLPMLTGQRILLPQSAIARPVLAEELRAAGAEVTALTAYRTVAGQGGVDVPRRLSAGQIDAITFTSSSTVRNFLLRLENEAGNKADLTAVCLAAIGPVTAETMQEHDLWVEVMPEEYTVPALVDALDAYFREQL
jgi:uroporphyrinogen-III synthase